MLNSLFRRRLRKRLNETRANHGLGPLSWGACVQEHAISWCNHLYSTDEFYHQDLGPIVNHCKARKVGEVLAKGYGTPRQVVRAWLNSDGHREVILRPEYDRVGISVKQYPSGEVVIVADLLCR